MRLEMSLISKKLKSLRFVSNAKTKKPPKTLKWISWILFFEITLNILVCVAYENWYFFFSLQTEVGSSLLRHPSPELSRLISAHSSLSKGERNFQWPVLAFVIQHHDLEGLEIAMKQALRKSACRVFAMEVRIHE